MSNNSYLIRSKTTDDCFVIDVPDNPRDLINKIPRNRIKKSEVEDYRIASLLKLFDDNAPIPKQQVLSQIRSAPISGMKVHATGSGSERIGSRVRSNGTKSSLK